MIQATSQEQPHHHQETGRRADPSICESLDFQGAGSPTIDLGSGEWQPTDAIDSVASTLSLAEPLNVMMMSEASPTHMATEDISVDIYPHHDLSEQAFLAVLPGMPPMPTMKPGSGANYLSWDSKGGADTHLHHSVQCPNLDNIYLTSPIASPTLP
jgi:hypothetical protein